MVKLVVAGVGIAFLAFVIGVAYRFLVVVGVPVPDHQFMTVYANSAYVLAVLAALGRFALFTRGY